MRTSLSSNPVRSRCWPAILILLAGGAGAAPEPTPAELYGDLFRQVQVERVFPDDKDFADSVPRRAPADIRADYEKRRKREGFDLAAFVRENFEAPRDRSNPRAHIEALWDFLRRDATHTPKNGSLLPLPQPYVVPGGRFQELYYWDSYFVMLGLKESGRIAMLEHMVDNFAHLIETQGFIPNASRTYYLTRSQPPFFSLMVELLAEARGEDVFRKYRPALVAEYAFWMDESRGHAVRVGSAPGQVLNRYYDAAWVPREEQYRTDVTLSEATRRDPPTLFHELRSAAESGWDFSSRWFADGVGRGSVRTTEILPVDLNCLLCHLEKTLVRAHRLAGDEASAKEMNARAAARQAAINSLFWSEETGWYEDFDLTANRRMNAPTLAGMAPFFLNVAPPERSTQAARMIEKRFLKPGGVVTTLVTTGEQWDAPNGWAPLQWMTIQGLRNYGHEKLAAEIARRWMQQNLRVFAATGKLMEKYDVEDLSRPAGGGEYPTQDGFGWTNGVLLRLLNLYGDPPSTR